MGMTHGTIAGILLTDLIHGRENPWATLYDPCRKPLRAAAEFVEGEPQRRGAVRGLAHRGDVASAEEIAPGHGAVVRRGLTKVAVYRDEQRRSARALGGLPAPRLHRALERAEKTWDCPCHGSRFGTDGRVLNGPAAGGLADV